MSKFPLAGLLRLRGIELDTAQGRLAGANQRAGVNRERRVRAMSDLMGGERTPSDSVSLMAVAAARAAASSQLTELDALIAAGEAEIEAAQTGYREAKMRTVPLEKMAERHRQAQTATELKAEQSALDEVATRRTASR